MLRGDKAKLLLQDAISLCSNGDGSLRGSPLNAALSGVYALQYRASKGEKEFKKLYDSEKKRYCEEARAHRKNANMPMPEAIDWPLALGYELHDPSHLSIWEECAAKLV